VPTSECGGRRMRVTFQNVNLFWVIEHIY
jgi:hypothetical protein